MVKASRPRTALSQESPRPPFSHPPASPPPTQLTTGNRCAQVCTLCTSDNKIFIHLFLKPPLKLCLDYLATLLDVARDY